MNIFKDLGKTSLIKLLTDELGSFWESFYNKPDFRLQKFVPGTLKDSDEFFETTDEFAEALQVTKTEGDDLKVIEAQEKLNFAKTLQQDYNIRYHLSRRQAICIEACDSRRMSKDLDKVLNINLV